MASGPLEMTDCSGRAVEDHHRYPPKEKKKKKKKVMRSLADEDPPGPSIKKMQRLSFGIGRAGGDRLGANAARVGGVLNLNPYRLWSVSSRSAADIQNHNGMSFVIHLVCSWASRNLHPSHHTDSYSFPTAEMVTRATVPMSHVPTVLDPRSRSILIPGMFVFLRLGQVGPLGDAQACHGSYCHDYSGGGWWWLLHGGCCAGAYLSI